jgi:hypothetical protein
MLGRPRSVRAAVRVSSTVVIGAVLATGLQAAQVALSAPAQAVTQKIGNDVGWPQCTTREPGARPVNMPRKSADFVIIGLNNGTAFQPNACLARQVAFAKSRHLWTGAYAMTTYPTRKQLARHAGHGPVRVEGRLSKLRNTGYAQARYNIVNMRRAGLPARHIWLDIEPSRRTPWGREVKGNRAVVRGALDAYRAAGMTVGFYSTKSLWRQILGSTEFRLPEWRTAGPTSSAKARTKCSRSSFQGGRAVLAQWWDSRRDHDLMCPGFSTDDQLRRYFVAR